MMRALLLASVTAISVAFWKVLRPLQPAPVDESSGQLERLRDIIGRADDPAANLALLGDKRFLWSQDQQAFIMYQVSGTSWISMGGPVGPASAHEELVWAFRELVDRSDGRPVFYQVSGESLALYVDMGLSAVKIGEDGRVPLGDFSLEGSRRADLRQASNRAVKHGATFEIVARTKGHYGLPVCRADVMGQGQRLPMVQPGGGATFRA